MLVVQKFLAITTYITISALWARSTLLKAKPGHRRFIIAAPIVVANCFAPLIFNRVNDFVLFCSYLLLLVWLANFKILALALGRGPLSAVDLSTSQFCILYALPITAKVDGRKEEESTKVKSNARFEHSAGSVATLAGKWAAKLVLLQAVVYVLTTQHWLPTLLAELAQAFMLYWFLGVMMDGPAALIGWWTGIQISPHFDSPYLSGSLAEFWSKRWNLTVGNLLRVVCYDPICEGRLVASKESSRKASAVRRASGTCWAFIVSGLMHELLIWYIEPKAATGEWLTYFVLQGPLVVIEACVKRFCQQQGIYLVKPIRIGLLILAQLLLAHWLFFPPSIRNHLDERFFANVRGTTAT